MEGIIGKESESILRFFILLENIQVKMDLVFIMNTNESLSQYKDQIKRN